MSIGWITRFKGHTNILCSNTKPWKTKTAFLEGANKICPNIYHSPEYDRFSWQISHENYLLIRLLD